MSNDEVEKIGNFIEQLNKIDMNAKEKAKDLIKQYTDVFLFRDTSVVFAFNKGKESALILVNKRLEELNFTHIGYGKGVIEGYQKTKLKYWNDVKKEIENYEFI